MLIVKKEFFLSIRALVEFANTQHLNRKNFIQVVPARDEPGYYLIYQQLDKEESEDEQ